MRISWNSRLWLTFTARQTMSIRSCVFTWNARHLPLGYMSVIDALEGAAGRLNVTALGIIPVARSTPSATLKRGELIRQLAELPFAPMPWRDVFSDYRQVNSRWIPSAMHVAWVIGYIIRARQTEPQPAIS